MSSGASCAASTACCSLGRKAARWSSITRSTSRLDRRSRREAQLVLEPRAEERVELAAQLGEATLADVARLHALHEAARRAVRHPVALAELGVRLVHVAHALV